MASPRLAAAVLILAFWAPVAQARGASLEDKCRVFASYPIPAVDACTRLLARDKLSRALRYRYLMYRGRAHCHLAIRDCGRAMEDFAAARQVADRPGPKLFAVLAQIEVHRQAALALIAEADGGRKAENRQVRTLSRILARYRASFEGAKPLTHTIVCECSGS